MTSAVPEAQDPLAAAVLALTSHDPNWRLVQAEGCVTGTRTWPDGTIDTVVLFGTGTGYAVREAPGCNVSLWTVKGSLVHVVDGALSVSAPEMPAGADPAAPSGEK